MNFSSNISHGHEKQPDVMSQKESYSLLIHCVRFIQPDSYQPNFYMFTTANQYGLKYRYNISLYCTSGNTAAHQSCHTHLHLFSVIIRSPGSPLCSLILLYVTTSALGFLNFLQLINLYILLKFILMVKKGCLCVLFLPILTKACFIILCVSVILYSDTLPFTIDCELKLSVCERKLSDIKERKTKKKEKKLE